MIHNEHHEINKKILDTAVKSIKEIFPVKRGNREVNITNVKYNYDPYEYDDHSLQKKIKLKNGTLHVPIKADVVIKEDGKVKARKTVTIAHVPIRTNRNTYIVRGNEYILSNQVRRKPGIYVVKKENKTETQFNTSALLNFNITLDNSGIYRIEYGAKTVPLYPVLVGIGVSDATLKRAFGDLYGVNAEFGSTPKQIESSIIKLYSMQHHGEKVSFEKARKGIIEYWSKNKFDPVVNKLTVGHETDTISTNAITSIIKQMREVYNGKRHPANPNDLKFKSFISPVDILHESITLDSKKHIKSKIASALSKNEAVKNPSIVVNKDRFEKSITKLFSGQTQLELLSDQINPLEDITASRTVTPLGTGGISNPDNLPYEARSLDDTHFGIIDPIYTPASKKIGLSLRYTDIVDPISHTIEVINAKTRKKERIPLEKYLHSNVATIEDFQKKKDKVKLIARSKEGPFKFVRRDEIDYLISGTATLGHATSLIPFLNKNHGIRMQMGAKALGQAVPLSDPDKPRIRTKVKGEVGAVEVQQMLATAIAPTSPVHGVVTRVGKNYITIKGDDGKTYKVSLPRNFFMNSDSLLDTKRILVKTGDRVKKEEILAETNFVKDKSLALGKHLRVAYLPYKGYTTKDGLVISESASKKLTSEHVYKKVIDTSGDNVITGKREYITYYPTHFSNEQLNKLDDNGIIKPGQKVVKNDPIALQIRKTEPLPDEKILGKLSRTALKEYKDSVTLWDKDIEGEVIEVAKSGKKYIVLIKTKEPAVVGDKLSNMYGGKGIIAAIVPDNKMPKDKDGKPIEAIFSPLAIPSRMNVGQLYEAYLSKVAGKLGKTISTSPFDEFTPEKKKLLEQKTGITEKELLYDPDTGKPLGEITVGEPYVLKLKQKSEKKVSGRATGPELQYSITMEPGKSSGSKTSAKSLDQLTQYSLLAHGAMDNLREMHTYKSEFNQPFWRALISGRPIPPPTETFALKKYKGLLNVLGVNLKKDDDSNLILTFLDKDEILKKSNGELKNPTQAVRLKDMMPVSGGIFDINIHGGLHGEKWGHIKLNEEIPNPFFENAIIKLTDLSKDKFNKILNGELGIDKTGNITKDYDITGPKAIKRLLDSIDIDRELAILYKRSRNATGNELNKIKTKISYLKALKETGKKKPSEAYFTDIVPVLPPIMRPITAISDKQYRYDDLNYLYRFMGKVNENLGQTKKLGAPDKLVSRIAGQLYNSLAHVQGVIKPEIIHGTEHKGVLETLAGPQPKYGYIQGKLFSKSQDFSGRAVLAPDFDITIDEAYIPEKMAWNLYKPFIIRELTTNFGISQIDALNEWRSRTDRAKEALEKVIEERPALFKRDPSLHRHNIIALKPKITADNTIKIHPLNYKSFGGDIDGDEINVYLPITDKAVKEAEKLKPSNNVIKYGFKNVIIHPEEDAVIGLWKMTQDKGGTPKKFATEKDVINALDRMDIKPYQKVKIGNKTDIAGRIYIRNKLPQKFRVEIDRYFPLSESNTKKFLKYVSLNGTPEEYKKVLHTLNDIGDEFAYKAGVTISIDDLTVDQSIRNQMKQALYLHGPRSDLKLKELEKKAVTDLKKKGSDFLEMLESGARGGPQHLQNMSLYIGDIQHPYLGKGPEVVKKNYNEGLSPVEYWFSLYQAREGLMKQQNQVVGPGEVAKEMLSGMLDLRVIDDDVPDPGLKMSVDDPDLSGRYLAKDVKKGNKVIFKRGELIDDKDIEVLKKNKIKEVYVRSPLTAISDVGIPAKSFGLKDDGQPVQPGDNIGVLAAQAATEPLTQLVLKAKHVHVKVNSFDKIKNMLELPQNSTKYAHHSPYSGRITKIDKTRTNYQIWVNNDYFTVPLTKKLTVKVGDGVEKGDKVTEGLDNYHELMEYRGFDFTRNKYLNDLKETYHKESGIPVGSRWLEVIARRITNNGEVVDPGVFSEYFKPGDIITATKANELEKISERDTIIKPYHAGLKLKTRVGKYPPGTVIDENNIKDLEGKRAKLTGDFKWQPKIEGLSTLAMTHSDFMTSMLAGRIKKQLTEYGASTARVKIDDNRSPYPQLITTGWV